MEQMNLGLTEISQEVFQMINRFVKSICEILRLQSFDQNFDSNVRKQFSGCLSQIRL